jgi:hypothetical protein
MDPRKKRIYIITIVVCFVLSAAILIWSRVDFSSSPSTTGTHALPVRAATGDVTSGFQPPSVFPVTDAFRTEVVKGSDYSELQPYTPLDITNQLGRPDPFKNY